MEVHPAMQRGLYVLDRQGRPVPYAGPYFDHILLKKLHRRVAWTERRGITVSTVFLGSDPLAQLFGRVPLPFETMVDDGAGWGDQRRYPTRHDALIGHVLVLVERGLE
jgi:hypothetical protein